MILNIMVSLTIVAAVESELVTWRFTRPQRHGSSSTTRDTLELEFLGANTSNVNDDDLLWTAPTCILSHNKGKVTSIVTLGNLYCYNSNCQNVPKFFL